MNYLDWRLWLLAIILVFFILWIFYGAETAPPFEGFQKIKEQIPDIERAPQLPETPLPGTVCLQDIPSTPIVQKDIQPHIVSIQQPRRHRSRPEQLCCQIMEKIYGVPFYSSRPNFLRNPETGALMEIDCYNPELKIGVEYNGYQHYNYPNHYKQTREQFLNQVRRDQLKRELCDKEGVYLITVDYTVKPDDLEAHIRAQLPESLCMREKN